MELIMIGTIHLDLKGHDRLRNALELIKLDEIAIEWPRNVNLDTFQR